MRGTVYSAPGYCPIFQTQVTFNSSNEWFRDYLACSSCGSIPRERALMVVIDRHCPDWRNLSIHESSPSDRGVSRIMRNECSSYTASQFFKDVTPGKTQNGYRCENLEAQTFANDTFDLVVTQDIFAHVFDPNAAHREIYRTLKPGGVHIFTVPIYKGHSITQQAARLVNGEVEHILLPEYHGNPVDDAGGLTALIMQRRSDVLRRSVSKFTVSTMPGADCLANF